MSKLQRGRLTLAGAALCATIFAGGLLARAAGQHAAAMDYIVYVVCESSDRLAKVRFGPSGGHLDQDLHVGNMPADVNGPHGIAFSPDRQYYYITLGHGRPYGTAWKYLTKDNSILGSVTLGFFPATADVTPDGNFLYVVNFNLHGDMVPSSVSVVTTDDMKEIARIPTCIMPHGSRINAQSTRQYSACMMDDMLVEIDTAALKVSRHFVLTKGKEMGMDGAPGAHKMAMGAGGSAIEPDHTAPDGDHAMRSPADLTCMPTWAQPSADGAFVYVACNKGNEILEIDAKSWKLMRRFPAGPGVYNLAVSHDGRLLLASNKKGPSASVFDLKTGAELARIPMKRKFVHGVVVSPDNRYAFVSVEGVGSEPGTVEVIDLAALKAVAAIDTPPQAAGIDFYRTELAKQ